MLVINPRKDKMLNSVYATQNHTPRFPTGPSILPRVPRLQRTHSEVRVVLFHSGKPLDYFYRYQGGGESTTAHAANTDCPDIVALITSGCGFKGAG